MSTLPCKDGGGSIYNEANAPKPYVVPDVCIGTWELTGSNAEECAANENALLESLAAEQLNISGAPINIYKLLGIHEQDHESLLPFGALFTSPSSPSYPSSGINTTSWRSSVNGDDVAGAAFVGLDFGIKLTPNDLSEYEGPSTNWQKVGSISLTQSNTPGYWAKQVRVDIADSEVQIGAVEYGSAGDGPIVDLTAGSHSTRGSIDIIFNSASSFNVVFSSGSSSIAVGSGTVGAPFRSVYVNFTVQDGIVPFELGDVVTIPFDYVWKRVALFSLIQSPSPQVLNLQQQYTVRAIRVVPVMFTGTEEWEVSTFDVSSSVPTDINNIQDIFFNENRDRDYAKVPVEVKVQYTPGDTSSDLSKFGLAILDQYQFTISFASMVAALGRPIVTGDILEVIPEMQYDHNLKPVRKFLEVSDTGWSNEGFTPSFKPIIFKFTAQQALPSQETRDLFGTPDTQKYLVPDPILDSAFGLQINTQPLTISEEIAKEANDDVPEIGTNDIRTVAGVPERVPMPPANPKGQPAAVSDVNKGKPNLYVESALPPNNEPYGEGFKLPEPSVSTDGDYFRLYYPPETKIPARLYRFSAVKNHWVYLETDRRGEYNSMKPSVQKIMQSSNKQSLRTKL
jgi:hypothetical protein